jgi:hypothetical protein
LLDGQLTDIDFNTTASSTRELNRQTDRQAGEQTDTYTFRLMFKETHKRMGVWVRRQ